MPMLQACLNGGRTKDFHPAVPVSPVEIAADVRAVVAAGAAELHIHARGADGLESLGAADVAAVLDAVRGAVPDVPVGLSTGWWIRPGGRARHDAMRRWTVLPDYVSVNLVEEDAADVIALMLEMGIGVEAGIWSVADAERFVALAEAPNCLRTLIEINEQDEGEGLVVARAILAILDRSGLAVPILLHGADATMWPIHREALSRGLDGRIGLEDGATLPSGAVAADNAALIAAARAFA